jgi:hypothetical protein
VCAEVVLFYAGAGGALIRRESDEEADDLRIASESSKSIGA